MNISFLFGFIFLYIISPLNCFGKIYFEDKSDERRVNDLMSSIGETINNYKDFQKNKKPKYKKKNNAFAKRKNSRDNNRNKKKSVERNYLDQEKVEKITNYRRNTLNLAKVFKEYADFTFMQTKLFDSPKNTIYYLSNKSKNSFLGKVKGRFQKTKNKAISKSNPLKNLEYYSKKGDYASYFDFLRTLKMHYFKEFYQETNNINKIIGQLKILFTNENNLKRDVKNMESVLNNMLQTIKKLLKESSEREKTFFYPNSFKKFQKSHKTITDKVFKKARSIKSQNKYLNEVKYNQNFFNENIKKFYGKALSKKASYLISFKMKVEKEITGKIK